MSGQLYENLRQLITVVDELRDCGLQNYISLPRIAACGTQSSGKSSLIESVVGLDFLPRGGGVVTRRPLELRLVHLSSLDHPEGTAWAVFDKSQLKMTDFNDVRNEIERLTDEVAGQNKGIVDDPIILTVYATGAPDLTLIDLPGITRVPVRGSDQKEDIEKLTRDMTLRYVTDPRTIIMAVLPANQDVSVSDALQMARRVDPKGLRTIGVVTKIDIMDQGTDACRILRGDDIPLRLGYVGVKMRSQADITAQKSVKLALEDEKEWFASHNVYSKLPPGYVGTTCLIDSLTKVLFKHIRSFLPDIKREINVKRRDVQTRLDELGGGVPEETIQRVQLMWTMVTDFTDMFKNNIRGRFDSRLQRYMQGSNASEMSSGSQLRTIFQNFLGNYTQERVSSGITDEEIDRAIQKHEGDALPGFPSPDTFEFLIIPHLKTLVAPALECVDSAAACLDGLSSRMGLCVLRRFPKLSDTVLNMAANIIQREKEATKIIVEQAIAAETGYLFTNDVNYLFENGQVQVETAPQSGQGMFGQQAAGNRQGSRYSGQIVNEFRKRLDTYFSLVVRNVRDVVPKTIGNFLVRQVEEKLQYELLSALNSDQAISELLGEPAHIHEERKALRVQLNTLMKAHGVLTRDPSLASIAFDAEEDLSEAPAKNMPQSKPSFSESTTRPPAGGNVFGGATARISQGLEQVKQNVTHGVVNKAVTHATGGMVKEVPAEMAHSAFKFAEKNPDVAFSAVKTSASLFSPLGR